MNKIEQDQDNFKVGDIVSRTGCGDEHIILFIDKDHFNLVVKCIKNSEIKEITQWKIGEEEHNSIRRYILIRKKITKLTGAQKEFLKKCAENMTTPKQKYFVAGVNHQGKLKSWFEISEGEVETIHANRNPFQILKKGLD